MSDPLLPPDQRSFTCPSCDGRIVIPVDLPPTTGPCPHCEATITSPEIEPEATQEVIEADLPTPSPAQESAAQAPVETTPEPANSTPEAAEPSPSVTPSREPTAGKKPAKSSKKPVVLLLIAVLVIGGIAAALFFSGLLGGSRETEEIQVLTPPSPNQASKDVLEAYLGAHSVEAKLAYVLNADALQTKIESFYQENSSSEADRGINTFKSIPLPDQDQSKGFVLFASIPSANASAGNAGSRILAFIKKTDDGPKLDWEVFAQTKFRTFRTFYETPQPGSSEVFRVLVKQVATSPSDTAPGTKIFQLQDPANLSDTLVVSVESASSIGDKLSTLSDRDQIRPATIELEWTDASELKIKRFICWEFLYLGAEDSAK